MYTRCEKQVFQKVVSSWILEGCVFRQVMFRCRVCWNDESFAQVDTMKVCILCMVWRVHMELSWVGSGLVFFFFTVPTLCCPGRWSSIGLMMPKFRQLINSTCDGKGAKFSCSFFRLMKGSLCFPTCHVQMLCREKLWPRIFIIYWLLVGYACLWWERIHLLELSGVGCLR